MHSSQSHVNELVLHLEIVIRETRIPTKRMQLLGPSSRLSPDISRRSTLFCNIPAKSLGNRFDALHPIPTPFKNNIIISWILSSHKRTHKNVELIIFQLHAHFYFRTKINLWHPLETCVCMCNVRICTELWALCIKCIIDEIKEKKNDEPQKQHNNQCCTRCSIQYNSTYK